MTEPEELPACAHCEEPITRDQPITITTDAEGNQAAAHAGCHRAYQEAG